MADKTETKKTPQKTEGKIEREYVIPLREKLRPVPRYKRANKAVKTIKEFLVRHMKIRDRDLNKVKLSGFLNEQIWARGIKNPPHKIKVKAIKESGKDEVRVELVDLPDKLKFKKAKLEKRESKAKEAIESKKKLMQKMQEKAKGEGKSTEKKEEEAEKKEEEQEKKAAVVEAGKKIEKEAAKKVKHEAKAAGKKTQQKHQQRKALAK